MTSPLDMALKMPKPAAAFFNLLPVQMAFALMLGAVTVSGLAPDTLFFLPLLTLSALFLLWLRASSWLRPIPVLPSG